MSKQQHLLAALTLSTLTCHLPFRTGVFPVLGESFETLHSGIGVFERNFRTQHPPQGSRTHTRERGASRDWSNFPLRLTASRIHRHLTSPLPGDSEFRQMISTSCPLLGTSGREHPSWHTCHTPLQGVAGCFLCLCVCITPPAVYPLGVAQIPQHTNQLPNNQNHFTGSLVVFDLKQGVIPHKRARAFNPTAYYGLTRQDPRSLSRYSNNNNPLTRGVVVVVAFLLHTRRHGVKIQLVLTGRTRIVASPSRADPVASREPVRTISLSRLPGTA